ncbi:MAG: hypothetical protein HYZ11_05540 [Candidatus Tectomicrobia bacterium]|uniref:Solute-binding protein family 5 domain-containing protein n=1 Tax=Tectimicrobiota bacterium TaxID=2528274 RepID=A0A932MMZ3_UNCTE|nr:hypothetical protein [Candidatus Tectomicrobia bacterium]
MRRSFLAALVLAAGVLAAPSTQAFKGEVTIALADEVPTMDPHIITSAIGVMVWRYPFDTLTSADTATGKVGPWLAERWEQISPTAIKFWLRKGVKFFDGTPVTSEAVKYSIGRIMDPANKSRSAPAFKAFDRVEILDDHTFIWHNKVPDNGTLNRMTVRPAIMSPKTKGWDKARFAREPAGSGPYILQSWTKGQRMVLEANPGWWANDRFPHRPKTVVLRRIQEASTRVKALAVGEVDLITQIHPQFMDEIKDNPNVEMKSVPSVRIMYLGFHTRHGGPFTDLNVRLAVNHAIDTASIIRTLLRGQAVPIGQMIHQWNYSGYNPDKSWYGYDPAKAKEYMRKSAYPDGFKATLLSPVGRFPADKQTCEAMTGMLKEIKIDAVCKPMTFALFTREYRAYAQGTKKDPAMYYMGFGNSSGDPGLAMISTSACGGGWSSHCFKDLDDAMYKALGTPGSEAQQAGWERVTDMIKAKATHKIMFQVNDVVAFQKKRIEFRPRYDEIVYAWEIVMK